LKKKQLKRLRDYKRNLKTLTTKRSFIKCFVLNTGKNAQVATSVSSSCINRESSPSVITW
jgi:hypothetical protein